MSNAFVSNSGLLASASNIMSGLTLASSVRTCSQKSVGIMAAASQRNPSTSHVRIQYFSISTM